MKYLLVLFVVLLAVWIWRNNRIEAGTRRETPPPAPRKPAMPVNMVACAHCQTHVPAHDALPGRGGVFCSTEHRRLHEEAQT